MISLREAMIGPSLSLREFWILRPLATSHAITTDVARGNRALFDDSGRVGRATRSAYPIPKLRAISRRLQAQSGESPWPASPASHHLLSPLVLFCRLR